MLVAASPAVSDKLRLPAPYFCAIFALLSSIAYADSAPLQLGKAAVDEHSDHTNGVILIPIAIEADEFTVKFEEDIAVWTGNVKAKQGRYTFNTEVLTINLDQVNRDAQPAGPAPANNQTQNGQQTPLAHNFELSARSLTYNLENDTIIGSGDSELRRGNEVISAESISYAISAKTASALPEEDGRVYVQFYSNPENPIFGPAQSTVSAAENTRTNRRLASAR